jgi:hypothetical protein
MKKINKKGLKFLRKVLFCLWNVLLQKYDSLKFEKNAFLQNRQLYTTFTYQFCPKILI